MLNVNFEFDLPGASSIETAVFQSAQILVKTSMSFNSAYTNRLLGIMFFNFDNFCPLLDVDG